MLGKLTWEAIPFSQPIPLVTGIVVVLIVSGIVGYVALKG